ncbi:hypothetical protein MRS44_008209 [Fusarium solani]|uniref:uncharacterized protein n=1 Tax=Fusarium solani TaxID=169388 RepID=UPI0032C4AE03|nr:hypothetical protein MRS44_008209 [Fusarium solani]
MLCQECKAVFKQPMSLKKESSRLEFLIATFQYDISLSDFEAKAKRCYSCRGILREIVKDRSPQLQGDSALQIQYSHGIVANQTRNGPWFRSLANLEGSFLGGTRMHFEKAQDEETPSLMSASTGSTDSLNFLKDCLEKCRTEHQSCPSTSSGVAWVPTRLIQVEQDGLRLVESFETTISEPFVSLSHCWGGAEILKLTTGNINTLKDDIPFLELPETFQDAIRVVRSLGIRYIWIDSLCIIQNSDQDWQKEASTMLEVYKYALFNIAATASTNSFGGLFQERDPHLVQSEVVDINTKAIKGRFHLVDQEYFAQAVDEAPLNLRSWVAQERMLSPRIAHFAFDQVIWDCAELTACESLPHGSTAWSRYESRPMTFGCKQGSALLAPAKTVDEGLGQWGTIVNTYSACGLTVLGDKLIAISGVANHLRDELKMEYCVGLWRPKMEIQLAWVVQSLQADRTPRNDLAPTWSWASLNGAVHLQQVNIYEGYDVSSLCSITEVSLRRETDEHRGEKVSGYLRMRCVLNPITLEGDAKSCRLRGKGMEEHGRAADVDSPDAVGAERLFFVPLFDVQAPMSFEQRWKVSSEIRGIIVQGVMGRPGVYTRCGHAFISGAVRNDTRKFDETYDALKSPEGKAELPCEEYDTDSGHLIKLI